MLPIPTNIYEQHLTSWLYTRLAAPFDSEQDREAIALLARLSKAQMKERNRGDEYPFIAKIQVEEMEHWVLQTYAQSENIQIRACCKDVLSKYTKVKEKLELAVSASEEYLKLYEELSSPWFLLRAVSVRSYKPTKSETFIEEVCRLLKKRIFPGWMVDLCNELRKSYSTSELSELSQLLEAKSKVIDDPKHRHEERLLIDALSVTGAISKVEAHFRKALSNESEVDYVNANKEPNTVYPNNVQIIQDAYNEIYEVRASYPEDFKRIELKLLQERQDFERNLELYGVRMNYSLSDDFMDTADKMIESANIKDAANAIGFLRGLPFITKVAVDTFCQKSAEAAPMMSMFGNERIGSRGLTSGTAKSDDAARIEAYQHYRMKWKYIIRGTLSKIENLNEKEIGQALCDCCKASYIKPEQVLFWARGLVSGLKGNFITAVHILTPQMERALVHKAESIYGNLSALNREEHQDAAGLSKALEKLKPHFKEDIYNDLKYFLNMGADVNLRNNVAHGLWNMNHFEEHGPYLWWLALKMFFCEEEMFN